MKKKINDIFVYFRDGNKKLYSIPQCMHISMRWAFMLEMAEMQIPGITDLMITLVDATIEETLAIEAKTFDRTGKAIYPVIGLAELMTNPAQVINQCVYETLKVFIESTDFENLEKLENVKQAIEIDGIFAPIPFRKAKSKNYSMSIDLIPGGEHTFGGELWLSGNDSAGTNRRVKLFAYNFHSLSLNLFKKIKLKGHFLSINSANFWQREAHLLPTRLHFDLKRFFNGTELIHCVDVSETQWHEMQAKLLS